MNAYPRGKKGYIVLIILVILGVIISLVAVYYQFFTKHSKNLEYKTLYSNSNMNIKEREIQVGAVSVTGDNSLLIQDYLNSVLSGDLFGKGYSISYNKEPNIENLNSILEKEGLIKPYQKYFETYSKIYKILQQSDNQELNASIVNELIENGYKLSPLKPEQIKSKLSETTLKGKQLEDVYNLVLGLKHQYEAYGLA